MPTDFEMEGKCVVTIGGEDFLIPRGLEFFPIEQGVPKIKKVIFNPPATIVLWSDGTKTVVKCQNEVFDREKGLAMAVAKKAMGNKSNFNNEFKKWIDEDDGVIHISAKVLKELRELYEEFEGGIKGSE